MKRNENGSAAVIGLLLIIIALVGFLMWRYIGTKDKPPTQQNNVGEKISEEIPAGFVVYTNEAAGFSFAYPQTWGEVELIDLDSPSKGDTYLLGRFTANPKINFGGDREDYSHDGRGTVPTDRPGYIKKDSSYFAYSDYGKKGDLEKIENAKSLEEIQATNSRGLYQKQATFHADEGEAITYYDIVRFNLKEFPYFGVNLVLELEGVNEATRQDFIKMVKTFKII